MKAILDHVGIAVRNLPEALAFYRDGLGLEVELSEEVRSQGLTAHFLSTGSASLELLEPTVDDSVVARYIARRGPGLHHITLRVDNLVEMLSHLNSRGVKLVDQVPRPGAEGALIAFIHPASAHGVLVELKQVKPPAVDLAVGRFNVGSLQISVLHDGLFRLDGGAMFGVVPRVLWERKAQADPRHRIQLAMRPALVEGDWGRLLIDCGAGDKWTPRDRDIYAFERVVHLDHALAEVGLTAEDIALVVPTHLHFDHCGGATTNSSAGPVARFPNARYAIRRAEWEDATHPHERNRASYLRGDFEPLLTAGAVDFFDIDHTIRPGVRIERTGGHTGQHQVIFIESGGQTAVFAADLIPTTAHVQDAWIMGYDLFPMDTLAVKRRLIRDAIEREHIIIFEHDPVVSAGYIRERDGRRLVEAVRYTNRTHA
jgi:methylmalonyl-CoA epimerase